MHDHLILSSTLLSLQVIYFSSTFLFQVIYIQVLLLIANLFQVLHALSSLYL
jgi:hypothetical protein